MSTSARFATAAGAYACAALLTACSPIRDPGLPAAPRNKSCDIASASVTTFGAARARLFAEQSLRNQLVDVKGEMVHSGLRRVRVVHQAYVCEQSAVYAGLGPIYQCAAKARICGY